MRHRDLDCLLAERQCCFNPARYQGNLSETYEQSCLIHGQTHLFGVGNRLLGELQPLLSCGPSGHKQQQG